MPFILRGVRLIGVNANSPMPLRREVWQRIATDLKPRHLTSIVNEIGLDQLPDAFARLIENRNTGRIVVSLQ
jgi:NADPH:quinone reductase-like Zn-dependent oxidoreductase